MTCNRDIIENLSDKIKLQNNYLQGFFPGKYDIDNPAFPCVLKKRSGEFSEDVFLIKTKEEYNKKIKTIADLHNYIVQEAINSRTEYSTQFLVVNGKIKYDYSYCLVNNKPLFVWPRTKLISAHKYKLTKDFMKTFEIYFADYNGLINANYKIIDNKPVIFEFNIRLSADIFYMPDKGLHELVKLFVTSCR